MLTVTESSALLNISPARVRALIAKGLLPARKVGSAWALEEKDVVSRLSKRPQSGRPASTKGSDGSPFGTAPAKPKNERQLHQLYLDCQQAFSLCPSVAFLGTAEDSEEAAFRMAVHDFFLQQRQRELVEQGVF